ncbi:MAG: SLC13 family permease [Gammaproteobacteria bacterium]
MMEEQLKILFILGVTVVLFVWGRWRHDIVALAALLACVFAGIVPAESAFSGFSHPAVITVACVLVLSQGLQTTGAVDALTQRVLPSAAGPSLTIAALTGFGAILSAFMNNVGAMALLMPVAIQSAGKHDLPPGKLLMPLSFGTILGGMTTLIGTPPNLIVSGFRASTGSGSFAMFDFTPVGLAIAALGTLFVALLGWRLVPSRAQKGSLSFDTGTYLTEAHVIENGKADGKTLREIESTLDDVDAQIVGMVRNKFRVIAPNPGRRLRAGDILVIEAEPEDLAAALSNLGLELEKEALAESLEQTDASKPASEAKEDSGHKKILETEETMLLEMVVRPGSDLIGRSINNIQLRSRYGLNLLALSRQGRSSVKRLRFTLIMAGDVLLLQGSPEALSGFASEFGCVPLAKRSIHIQDKRKVVIALIVMALAIGGAALGLLPAAISFAAGALLFTLLRIVPARNIYEAIDWPVILLLAALIPVAGTMTTSGAADLISRWLIEAIGQGRPLIALMLILVVTMTLSDFMNNAATAAVMCPIALSTAATLGTSADPFLMAVAIGASCAFLTPIGHQNNLLILGPGGFRFSDYWRMGLPMEILVVAVSIIILPLIWPL